MRVFQHPNGQKQAIDCDQEFVWVHPKAKKLDFGWSPIKDRLYSAKALAVPHPTKTGELINEYCAKKLMEIPVDAIPTAIVPDEDNAYEQGWRDAIAHCYCPGATIEMASRVQNEARRLGL